MSESLLRLLRAIRNAKLAIEAMLRMQYKAAGYPFGESEEGLIIWREKLAKDYALCHEKAVPSEFTGNVFDGNHKDSRDVSEHFNSLEEESKKNKLNI
jgi:hypothetical protein